MATSKAADHTQLCDLCDSSLAVKWRCRECEETLCDTCKKLHQKSKASRNHAILSLDSNISHTDTSTTKVEESKNIHCQNHPTEELQRYCKTCDEALCIECIAVSHHGHTLVKLSDILGDKKRQLSNLIKEIKSNRISKLNDTIQNVRDNKEMFKTETEKIITEINNKAEKLKEEVDQIRDMFIDEIRGREKDYIKDLERNEYELESELTKLKLLVKNAEDQLASESEIKYLIKVVNDLKKKCENTGEVTNPVYVDPTPFVPIKSSRHSLKMLYGYIVMDTDDQLSSDVPRGITTNLVNIFSHYHNEYTKEQQTHYDISRVNHICTVDDRAWIHSSFKSEDIWSEKYYDFYLTEIMLVQFDGKVIRNITFDDWISGMTVTSNRDLLISNQQEKKILLLQTKEDNFEKYDGKNLPVFVNTQPHEPHGLSSTQTGYIFACLIKQDSKKIVQYTSTARVAQSFEFSDSAQPLFQDPTAVTVNKYDDMWIIDSGSVQVLSCKGKHKFNYRGITGYHQAVLLNNHKIQSKFDPRSVTSNKYGHVLICDYGNSMIHVVDHDGNTVDLISTQRICTEDLGKPVCVADDDRNTCLWIASDLCKVSVSKYNVC